MKYEDKNAEYRLIESEDNETITDALKRVLSDDSLSLPDEGLYCLVVVPKELFYPQTKEAENGEIEVTISHLIDKHPVVCICSSTTPNEADDSLLRSMLASPKALQLYRRLSEYCTISALQTVLEIGANRLKILEKLAKSSIN